jgi:hypothetical protein
MFVEIFDEGAVPALNHLVKEEIIPLDWHFLDHRLETPEPGVGLLRSRRIETPFTILSAELGPNVRVAVCTAVDVRLLVFGFEMKDVNRKGNILEIVTPVLVGVVTKHLHNVAVVVMPEDIRKGCFGWPKFHPKLL